MDDEAVDKGETRGDDGEEEESVVFSADADVEPNTVMVEAINADATLVAVLRVGVYSVVAVGAEVLAGLFGRQVLGVFDGGEEQQTQQDEVARGVQRCVQFLAEQRLPSSARA